MAIIKIIAIKIKSKFKLFKLYDTEEHQTLAEAMALEAVSRLYTKDNGTCRSPLMV